MKRTYSIFIVTFVLMATLASCGGGGNKTKTGEGKDSTATANSEGEGSSESLNSSGDQSDGSSNATDPKIAEVIQAYSYNLSNFKAAEIQSLFADNVTQYIRMKNTTGEALAKEAVRFLSTKKLVAYTPDMDELKVNGKTATVPMNIEWAGYQARVLTEIEFDDNYKIVSLKETKKLSPKYDNLKLTKTTIIETYQGCDHKNKKEGCTYYLADLQLVANASNTSVKDAINNYIFKSVSTTAPTEPGIVKEAKDFIKSFDAMRKSGSVMSDFYQDTYSTIRNMGKYATVSVTSEGFAGGAHGYSSIFVTNIDNQTGQQLKLADLLTSEDALKPIATKIFRKLNRIPDDKTINQYGYTIDDNEKFVFAKSFALKNDRIEFYYGRYEAGPYSMGPPMLSIKYDEIKDLIKKDGILGDKIK